MESHKEYFEHVFSTKRAARGWFYLVFSNRTTQWMALHHIFSSGKASNRTFIKFSLLEAYLVRNLATFSP